MWIAHVCNGAWSWQTAPLEKTTNHGNLQLQLFLATDWFWYLTRSMIMKETVELHRFLAALSQLP